MEGDTPSFLNLIRNGLSNPAHPDYGGWGGRYEFYLPEFRNSNTGIFKREDWPADAPETRAIWTNVNDSVWSSIDNKSYSSNQATLWRWREAPLTAHLGHKKFPQREITRHYTANEKQQ